MCRYPIRRAVQIVFMITSSFMLNSIGTGQAATPMDPSLFPNDTCKKCHTSSGPPRVDYSKPECVECHSVPDDENYQPVSDKRVALPFPPRMK